MVWGARVRRESSARAAAWRMSGMRTGARRSHSLSAQSVEADNRSASLARTDHTAPECASTESVHVSVRRSHLVRNFVSILGV